MDAPPENEELQDALSLKEKGNECVKCGNFKEAALLYTQAIKIEPENYSLYSNRSLAYLRLKHYHLAINDANDAIRLQPDWAKGYFRRAEVESAVGLADEAILSYARALQLLPQDANIIDAIKRVKLSQKLQNEADQKLPWVCACVGLILGVIIVILDYVLKESSVTVNPIMQVAIVLAIAGGGWGVGRTVVLMLQRNVGKPLLPPEEASDSRPWQYWLTGLMLGISLMIMDCTVTEFFGLKNPVSQIGFALAIAGIGWGIGTALQRRKSSETKKPTEEPVEESPVEENSVPGRNRYTKAQAKYRYKKGKM